MSERTGILFKNNMKKGRTKRHDMREK